MRNVLFASAAVLALSAAPAMAFWGGGSNGNSSFDQWASGTVMSGSANEFGAVGKFEGTGAGIAGFAGSGWNSGTANVTGSFSDTGFSGHADSWNAGAAIGAAGGIGAGMKFLEFNAGSFGQSLGEMNFKFDNR